MKKKFLTLFLFISFTTVISAQEINPQVGYSTEKGFKTDFKKNKAKDNWFISAGAGMGVLFGDQNGNADFKNRLNTNPHLAAGKWFNPYFGTRLYVTGGVLHGFEGSDAQFMQHNKYMAGHIDFMYNIINHLGRYNEKRIFSIIPWAGIGYAQRFKNQGRARSESPTFNAGILTSFRLNKRFDFNIELQGSLLNEHFNRVQMGKVLDGIGQLSAGFTYKPGKTDFEVIQPMNYNLINDLNDRINTLRAANEELAKRPVSCPEPVKCPEPETKVVSEYSDNIVFFRIGSSKIDRAQEINIYNAAQIIKKTGKSVKITGFADQATGTAEYNLQLSEKRANAVAKVLIEKYGISSQQMVTEGIGSSKQPYDQNDWNRIVVITLEK